MSLSLCLNIVTVSILSSVGGWFTVVSIKENQYTHLGVDLYFMRWCIQLIEQIFL